MRTLLGNNQLHDIREGYIPVKYSIVEKLDLSCQGAVTYEIKKRSLQGVIYFMSFLNF